MAETRGYTATKEQLNKRLARIEGQVRGVSRMVDEDRYCIDVLTQISAIQAALDKVALGLLDSHARHCLLGEGTSPDHAGSPDDEVMSSVGRLMRRGLCARGRRRSSSDVGRRRRWRRSASRPGLCG